MQSVLNFLTCVQEIWFFSSGRPELLSINVIIVESLLIHQEPGFLGDGSTE